MNELDFNTFTLFFGSKEGDILYNPNCDLNQDGKINGVDLINLLLHMGEDYRFKDYDDDEISNYVEKILTSYGIDELNLVVPNSLKKIKEKYPEFYNFVFKDFQNEEETDVFILTLYEIILSYRYSINDLKLEVFDQETKKDILLEYKKYTMKEKNYLKKFTDKEIKKLIELNRSFKQKEFKELTANILLSQINVDVDENFVNKIYEIVKEFDQNDYDIFMMLINQPSEFNYDRSDVLYDLYKKKPELFDEIPRTILAHLVGISQFIENNGFKIQIETKDLLKIFYRDIRNNIDINKAVNILVKYFSGIVEREEILKKRGEEYKKWFGFYPTDLDKLRLRVLIYLNPFSRELRYTFSTERIKKPSITLEELFEGFYDISREQKDVAKLAIEHDILNPVEIDHFFWRHRDRNKRMWFQIRESFVTPKKYLTYIKSFFKKKDKKIPMNCMVVTAFASEYLRALNVPFLDMAVNKVAQGKFQYGGHEWINAFNEFSFKTIDRMSPNLFVGEDREYRIFLPILVKDTRGFKITASIFLAYPHQYVNGSKPMPEITNNSMWKLMANKNGATVDLNFIMIFFKTEEKESPTRKLSELVDAKVAIIEE